MQFPRTVSFYHAKREQPPTLAPDPIGTPAVAIPGHYPRWAADICEGHLAPPNAGEWKSTDIYALARAYLSENDSARPRKSDRASTRRCVAHCLSQGTAACAILFDRFNAFVPAGEQHVFSRFLQLAQEGRLSISAARKRPNDACMCLVTGEKVDLQTRSNKGDKDNARLQQDAQASKKPAARYKRVYAHGQDGQIDVGAICRTEYSLVLHAVQLVFNVPVIVEAVLTDHPTTEDELHLHKQLSKLAEQLDGAMYLLSTVLSNERVASGVHVKELSV